VNGVIRLLPGRQVASGRAASRRGNLQIIIVVDVAGSAGHVRVAVRQQEPCCAVVKCRSQPAVKFVATLAIAGGEGGSGAGVRGICGVLPIFQVAGIASGTQSEEHPRGRLLMAFIALNRGMSAEERKAVLVIANLLDGDVPTLRSVALRAVRTHLAAVDVSVAVGAIFADVCKYGFCVTLRALHFFVQAAERVFGLVVIEFGDRADRPPACRCVTVFARNV